MKDLRHFEQVLVGGVLGNDNVAQIFLKKILQCFWNKYQFKLKSTILEWYYLTVIVVENHLKMVQDLKEYDLQWENFDFLENSDFILKNFWILDIFWKILKYFWCWENFKFWKIFDFFLKILTFFKMFGLEKFLIF